MATGLISMFLQPLVVLHLVTNSIDNIAKNVIPEDGTKFYFISPELVTNIASCAGEKVNKFDQKEIHIYRTYSKLLNQT
jgi:hypothetical protein